MHHYTIEPHNGIGPIRLGMSRSDVESIFGKPQFEQGERVGYLDGFMIDFDEAGRVEFIELANSLRFTATYRGKDLHALPADEVVELVGQDDSFDQDDPEVGYSYIFKGLQLSLWRPTLPQSPADADGQHFQAVGLASDGYFE